MKMFTFDNNYDFEVLKKGDNILVEWDDYYIKHHEGCKKFMLYQIIKNKKETNEIILRKKDNHFFNWKMYLDKKSHAKSIMLVVTDDDVYNMIFKEMFIEDSCC